MPSEFDFIDVSRHVQSERPVVIEAGAFDGKDTRAFAEYWPGGTIFAFEPLPLLAQRVRDNTAHLSNVVLVEAALGVDDAPFVDLHTFEGEEDIHASSSILKPGAHLNLAPEVKFERVVRVPALTLDSWYESVGLPPIDLMWLDLQGVELRVLQKGLKALSNTRVIHIEVSRKPLYEGGARYREVKSFLEGNGFALKSVRMPVRSGNAIFLRRHS